MGLRRHPSSFPGLRTGCCPYGWVGRSSFAEQAGWSLTTAGRRRNEAQLRAELDRVRAHGTVADTHELFLTLNGGATRVFTAWQLRHRARPPGRYVTSPASPTNSATSNDT
ncbi:MULTISPECIES: hypothetical protein [unclassified Micromonospora]|uniref:hypothetical protein n=1 Tax=unclassified Micromonospora TaxID=2617518 RepID=UPI001C5D471E|nr:hypothetical protein [Micromonospora sp. RL09-050-HVF-A]MBW4700489.1 hypothetical protein [Micromonospora sp. RL09-050-HVF-A]